jgi:hypothetical protein
MNEITPILIGGCDRSGTTFLGSILGVHPQLVTIPESQFFINLMKTNQWDIKTVTKRDVIQGFYRDWRFNIWDLELLPETDDDPKRAYQYREVIQWVVRQYAKKISKQSITHWVDHTPVNISNGFIWLDLFPSAKLIHIVRDGRAVANSIIPLDWGPNTTLWAAEWWKKKVAVGLAAETYLRPDQIRRVYYEELVMDPENTLKGLCAFIGIDYSEQMMNANGFIVPRYSKSQHLLVGLPPEHTRVSAWKSGLCSRQIAIFESVSGSLLTYLGYKLEHYYNPLSISKMEKIRITLHEYLLALVNRVKHGFRKYLI